MTFLEPRPEYGLHQLRFTQSPLAGRHSEPATLRITPGQQRILGEPPISSAPVSRDRA